MDANEKYRVPNHKEHFLIFNLWGEEQWYFDILDHFLKIQSSTIWLRLFRIQWFGFLYLYFLKQKIGESVSKLFIVQNQNAQIHSEFKYFSQIILDNDPNSHFATKEHNITNIFRRNLKNSKVGFCNFTEMISEILLPIL